MAGYPCSGIVAPYGFAWVSASHGSIPSSSVYCGNDGSDMTYVGRAHHGGDLIPGKIVPSHHGCYVSYDGKEHLCKSYEVLSTNGGQFHWIHATRGHIPPNAIQGGKTSCGEPLYIGRHRHDHHALVPGKIHPSHQCLYIPYGGREHRYDDYEVLVAAPHGGTFIQPSFPSYPVGPSYPPGQPYPARPTYPAYPGTCNPPW